jgi:hypothetical protein
MLEHEFQVKDGKSVVKFAFIVRDYLKSLKNGWYVITIRSLGSYKTWRQIKAVKGVLIPEISKETGETKKEVERRLKLDYGVCEYFDKDGVPHVEMTSFAYYKKDEMQSFISQTLDHCEYDLGFVIDLKTRKKLMIS